MDYTNSSDNISNPSVHYQINIEHYQRGASFEGLQSNILTAMRDLYRLTTQGIGNCEK